MAGGPQGHRNVSLLIVSLCQPQPAAFAMGSKMEGKRWPNSTSFSCKVRQKKHLDFRKGSWTPNTGSWKGHGEFLSRVIIKADSLIITCNASSQASAPPGQSDCSWEKLTCPLPCSLYWITLCFPTNSDTESERFNSLLSLFFHLVAGKDISQELDEKWAREWVEYPPPICLFSQMHVGNQCRDGISNIKSTIWWFSFNQNRAGRQLGGHLVRIPAQAGEPISF